MNVYEDGLARRAGDGVSRRWSPARRGRRRRSRPEALRIARLEGPGGRDHAGRGRWGAETLIQSCAWAEQRAILRDGRGSLPEGRGGAFGSGPMPRQ